MIVVDASAMVEFLAGTSLGRRVEDRLFRDGDDFHAPHLVDAEVLRGLRRYVLDGVITPERAEEALDDLSQFAMLRYPHHDLLHRAWALRDNVTTYDALYVALAESLDATLVTCDAPLGRTPGHSAQVEVVS